MINCRAIAAYIRLQRIWLWQKACSLASMFCFKWNLKTATAYAEFANKCVTTAAILVGGVWAYWTFGIQRTAAWNGQIVVATEVLPYAQESRLLLIGVTLKNVGHVLIPLGTKGCQLSVRKLPRNIKPDQLLASTEDGQMLTWTQLGEEIVSDVNILRIYQPGTYQLEPGVEYHEIEPLVVSPDDLLLLKLSYWASEKDSDVISEYRLVHIPANR